MNILAAIVTGKLYNLIDYTFDMIELFFCDQRNKEEKIIIKMISDENNKRLLRINLDNKNILVTGAAGFIGSNLIKRIYREVPLASII